MWAVGADVAIAAVAVSVAAVTAAGSLRPVAVAMGAIHSGSSPGGSGHASAALDAGSDGLTLTAAAILAATAFAMVHRARPVVATPRGADAGWPETGAEAISNTRSELSADGLATGGTVLTTRTGGRIAARRGGVRAGIGIGGASASNEGA